MTNLTPIDKNRSPFDSIRHLDEQGHEYWLARELMPVLGYKQWRQFNDSIQRAIVSCEVAGNAVRANFLRSTAKSRGRNAEDYKLARYACYLTAMNGDPRKPEIAAAQSYFATKTRERELDEQKALEGAKEIDSLAELKLRVELSKNELEKAKLENKTENTKLLPQIIEWRSQGILDDLGTAQVVEQLTGSNLNILPPVPSPIYLNGKLVSDGNYVTQEFLAKRYNCYNKKGKPSSAKAMKLLESLGAGKGNTDFWEQAYDEHGRYLWKFKYSAIPQLDKLYAKAPQQGNVFQESFTANKNKLRLV